MFSWKFKEFVVRIPRNSFRNQRNVFGVERIYFLYNLQEFLGFAAESKKGFLWNSKDLLKNSMILSLQNNSLRNRKTSFGIRRTYSLLELEGVLRGSFRIQRTSVKTERSSFGIQVVSFRIQLISFRISRISVQIQHSFLRTRTELF